MRYKPNKSQVTEFTIVREVRTTEHNSLEYDPCITLTTLHQIIMYKIFDSSRIIRDFIWTKG